MQISSLFCLIRISPFWFVVALCAVSITYSVVRVYRAPAKEGQISGRRNASPAGLNVSIKGKPHNPAVGNGFQARAAPIMSTALQEEFCVHLAAKQKHEAGLPASCFMQKVYFIFSCLTFLSMTCLPLSSSRMSAGVMPISTIKTIT